MFPRRAHQPQRHQLLVAGPRRRSGADRPRRRRAGLRHRLGGRPPDPGRPQERSGLGDARGLYDARLPRRADRADPARHDGHRGHVPAAERADQGRDDARRALRRPRVARRRRRLPGGRGARDGPAAATDPRALRAARGDAALGASDVVGRQQPVRGAPLSPRAARQQPACGQHAASADPRRRHGRAQDATPGGSVRGRLQPVRHPRRRQDDQAQARGAGAPLRRGRPLARRRPEDGQHADGPRPVGRRVRRAVRTARRLRDRSRGRDHVRPVDRGRRRAPGRRAAGGAPVSTTRLQITPGEALDVLERTPAALVVEAAYAPGGSPPPRHYHPSQDEHFEIREGVLRVELAGVQRDLRAGDTLDVPRGTTHRMWNPHARPVRSRWETRPAGRTEQWLAAVAALQGTDQVDADGRPKPLPFAALAHEYRDTFRLAAGPDAAGRIAVATLAGIARATGRAPQPPPRDLGALSGALAGVTFVGGLAGGLAIADVPYPRPGAGPAAIRRYFEGSARAARVSVAGQLLSAASLTRFTGTVAALARDARSRRLERATTVAGGLASASLAASALTSLALTRGAGSNARAVALHRRLFVAGGPLHTAAFGALVGCLSLAGRRTERLPRALTAAGFAAAAAGALSPVSMVAEPAVLLIPAGRVWGLLVSGIAGTRISRPQPR